ncbi:conserved hypothetical protein [Methanocaldococcus infernus ME]|uniref:Uncharacterized protein n=1 Tax=Methanocaldococcus infernus (strain DSM 11812 / JCM 15783 / ME) TaxID=573063 RepID=D5VRM0_METIM|nr:hypothetical protein [Methanocaldococcus infernus]ADG13223.1 conserved hypothetical protein [Methanocaldococcus infernus ME]
MIPNIKKIIDNILYIYENLSSDALKYILIKRILIKCPKDTFQYLPEEVKSFLTEMDKIVKKNK